MHQEIVTLRQTLKTARSRRKGASNGNPNSFTTMCSSQSIPDYGPMRQAWHFEFRDVTIADDDDLGKTILEIEVCGKRAVGYCKSMPGAVLLFQRLRSRPRTARVYGVKTPQETSVTSRLLENNGARLSPPISFFPSGSASFSKRSSKNRSFVSTAKVDPVRPTVCGIQTSACA
jgi:hypothetical protein